MAKTRQNYLSTSEQFRPRTKKERMLYTTAFAEVLFINRNNNYNTKQTKERMVEKKKHSPYLSRETRFFFSLHKFRASKHGRRKINSEMRSVCARAFIQMAKIGAFVVVETGMNYAARQFFFFCIKYLLKYFVTSCVLRTVRHRSASSPNESKENMVSNS